MAGRARRRPSKFFYVTLPALIVGILVAAFAGKARPSYALNSNVVWRFEIGLVIFGIIYVVALLLFLAWQGKAPEQIGGGPAKVQTAPQVVDGGEQLSVELPDPETDQQPPA